MSNLGYQRYQGQQLRRSGIENQEDGLADWFVIKHTRDTTLSRDLLSKYGFVAGDATQVGINTKNIREKGMEPNENEGNIMVPFFCVRPAGLKFPGHYPRE